MGPADEDLRAARRAADLEDVRLDVLADAVVLDGRLLGRGEDRLDVVADVEDDRPRLDAVDRAGDHLALAARELVEDLVALDLAEALEDDLLGGLGADPAEDVAVELLGLDELAELGVGLVRAGLLERELDRAGPRPRRRRSRARKTRILPVSASIRTWMSSSPATRR